jgi:hypothetical protein
MPLNAVPGSPTTASRVRAGVDLPGADCPAGSGYALACAQAARIRAVTSEPRVWHRYSFDAAILATATHTVIAPVPP